MNCIKALRKQFLALFVGGILFFGAALPAYAATFTVNTTVDAVDANPGDGICATSTNECTLRAAVQEANALTGADTITFASGGTYLLTIPGNGEDVSATGDLDLTSDMEIISSVSGVVVDGGSTSRVFHILNQANVDIRNLTIQNGVSENGDVGGGIRNEADLQLFNSVVTNNQNSGIVNTGILDIRNSTISNNSGSNGGGLFTIGFVGINRSTFSGNTANLGGAVYSNAAVFFDTSTVSGNFASTEGGAAINNNRVLVFRNSTVVNNTAGEGIGGVISILSDPFDETRFDGTIIANNSGANCSGTTTSNGFNLSNDSSCALTQPTDLQNTDPMIAGLANNGGPTQTHALLVGSLAIEGGRELFCTGTDQRGVTRPQGTRCDIGAYEFDGTSTTPGVGGTSTSVINDEHIINTPGCTDQAPTGTPVLKILEIKKDSVTLSWTASDPITHYAVVFVRDSDGAQYGSTDIGKGPMYTVNFLNPGESYTFEVIGFNGCMAGPRSNRVSSKRKPVVHKASIAPATPAKQKGYDPDVNSRNFEEEVKEAGAAAAVASPSAATVTPVIPIPQVCREWKVNLPWVLLVLQSIATYSTVMTIEKENRQKRFISLSSITLISIILFYLLRVCNCAGALKFLGWLCKWYWAVSIFLSLTIPMIVDYVKAQKVSK